MKTSVEYKQSLKKMRPNIYKFGELIKDVTTHPATKRPQTVMLKFLMPHKWMNTKTFLQPNLQ